MQDIFNQNLILLQNKRQSDFKLYQKTVDLLLENFEDSKFIYQISPSKVLDVNCKNWYLVESLKSKGLEAIGTNFFEEVLNQSLQFDAIFAPLTLHKANKIENVFSQINKMLLKNGIFLGTFFGTSNLTEIGEILANEDFKAFGQPLQRMMPVIPIKLPGATALISTSSSVSD